MDPTVLRYEEVARLRPVALVSAVDRPVLLEDPGTWSTTPLPRVAPYVGIEAGLEAGPDAGAVGAGPGASRLAVTLAGDGLVLRGVLDDGLAWLEVDGPDGTRVLRSRRSGRVTGPVDALGLVLAGTHAVVLTRTGGRWTGRARTDLLESRPDVPVRDPTWLRGLSIGHEGPATHLLAGGSGQLGLRDVRLVTHADGTAYDDGSGLTWLCATSAGPGHFGTGHTSVWTLDRGTLEVAHTADLFFTRPGGHDVFGDHATHLLHDGSEWLAATSTWGDLDTTREDARVDVTLARVPAGPGGTDPLRGVHVLSTEPLALPTQGRRVGVWDPHLVRTGEGWLVGYVQATRFFRFHPVLAQGPGLDALHLAASDPRRRATEGTTLLPRPEGVLVLASDGRDGRRGAREQWVVLDRDLRERGTLAAAYPTNIPWPTLVPDGDGWLLVTFDGTRHGGRVCGYGTHGDLLVLRGALEPTTP